MVDVKREATYQDVIDAPEHRVAEIIDGELVLSPRATPRHASVASILGAELIINSEISIDINRSSGWSRPTTS